MVPESPLESTEYGLVPTGRGSGSGISSTEHRRRSTRSLEWTRETGCDVVAVGARDRPTGPARRAYTVDEAAPRHNAGVEEETTDADEVYARFAPSERSRYRESWLP
jgi:hypothetical protein